jgi:hypothetical protein
MLLTAHLLLKIYKIGIHKKELIGIKCLKTLEKLNQNKEDARN